MAMQMPPWYHSVNDWLLAKGWTFMTVVALAIIAFTLFLLWRRKPIPLALWLTYLALP